MKKVLVVNAIDLEQIPVSIPNAEVRCMLSGIGKVNAAMNVMKEVLEYRPDYVLNIGSAGTLNHNVGDIIVSNHFVDRDLNRLQLFGLEYEISTLRPEGWNIKSCIGKHEVEGDFIVNTGDDFVTKDSGFAADAIDMEVFAEAMVCRKMNIPMLSIKYITDVVGQNSVALWEEKLSDARAGLSVFLEKNISFLA